MKYLIYVLGTAFILLSVSACSGKMDRMPAEKPAAKVYGNLLFVGAYDNRKYRVSAETLFSKVLKEEGISAAPSYDLLPGLKNIQNNTEVSKKLEGTPYDAVLIVSVLEQRYTIVRDNDYLSQGFIYLLEGRPPYDVEKSSFIAWAGMGNYEVYAGLWDAGTLRPVWQVTTDAKTTGSDTKDNRVLAEFVAEQLKNSGWVKVNASPSTE